MIQNPSVTAGTLAKRRFVSETMRSELPVISSHSGCRDQILSNRATAEVLYVLRANSRKPHLAATRSDAAFSGSIIQTVRAGRCLESIHASAARAASVA